MKKNIQTVFAVSLAAILAISAVSVMTSQEAEASREHWKFKKKPSFTATLAVTPMAPAGFEGEATAKFWLDKNGEALKYRIKINNMDISGGATSDTADDVTKLHLHEGHHNAHVLNVYKAPGEDDNNLVVKPTKGVIKGIWDDSDENLTYEDPHNNSQKFTSQLHNLCSGNLFTMIHGDAGIGVLKGFIIPTAQGEKLCDKLVDDEDDGEHEEH